MLKVLCKISVKETTTTNQALTCPYIDVLPNYPVHLRLHGDYGKKHLYTLYSLCPDILTDIHTLAVIYYSQYYYYYLF